MAVLAWRVSQKKYAASMFGGAGAAEWGGRWNSRDRAVRFDRRIVYTSATLSLAMLEILAHVDDPEVFATAAHAYAPATLDEAFVQPLNLAALGGGWDAVPETPVSQAVGDQWYDASASPILRVPSVVITPLVRQDPLHSNYLLNTRHPDFARAVTLGAVEDLVWDPRMKRAP